MHPAAACNRYDQPEEGRVRGADCWRTYHQTITGVDHSAHCQPATSTNDRIGVHLGVDSSLATDVRSTLSNEHMLQVFLKLNLSSPEDLNLHGGCHGNREVVPSLLWSEYFYDGVAYFFAKKFSHVDSSSNKSILFSKTILETDMPKDNVTSLNPEIKPGSVPSVIEAIKNAKTALVMTVDQSNNWNVTVTNQADGYKAIGMLHFFADYLSDLMRKNPRR